MMGEGRDLYALFGDCIQAAMQHGVSLPCETLLHSDDRDRREPSPEIASARIRPWRLDRFRSAPIEP